MNLTTSFRLKQTHRPIRPPPQTHNQPPQAYINPKQPPQTSTKTSTTGDKKKPIKLQTPPQHHHYHCDPKSTTASSHCTSATTNHCTTQNPIPHSLTHLASPIPHSFTRLATTIASIAFYCTIYSAPRCRWNGLGYGPSMDYLNLDWRNLETLCLLYYLLWVLPIRQFSLPISLWSLAASPWRRGEDEKEREETEARVWDLWVIKMVLLFFFFENQNGIILL